jgi:hypothetical protein
MNDAAPISVNARRIGLRDLRKRMEKVLVGETGEYLEVQGVTAAQIDDLMGRFPQISDALSGKGVKGDDLVKLARPVLCALIASSIGRHGEDEAEKEAASLTPEMQVEIIAAMARATFGPGGFGPFVDRAKVMFGAGSAPAGRPEDSKLPNQLRPSRQPMAAKQHLQEGEPGTLPLAK